MNGHQKEAERLSAEASLLPEWDVHERTAIASRGQIEATLSLAYEQRTANLTALYNLGGPDSILTGLDYGALATQIKERLGLA